MRGPTVAPIIIAAGGTGGHLFPAEALAAELTSRGLRIALMTDARSGAIHSETFASRETFVLRGAGIAGRGAFRAATAALALGAGTFQAATVLFRVRPAVLVAFGGYPSIPPVLGARLLRHRPSIILHEQNAVLGRANRFLARHASLLALSFAGTARVPSGIATDFTGNPVRPAIAGLATTPYAPPTNPIRLAVLGGSLGARVFSDIVPPAIIALPEAFRVRLHLTQQCRMEDITRVRQTYAQAGITADLSPFFADIADRLAAAHLVIARAGASTVAELAVAARPSILVPLPGAIDDHQLANARALVTAGAARMIPQPKFSAPALTAVLIDLLSNPVQLTAASQLARSIARPDAAARLADLVESFIPQEVRP
ncbi:MAG: undecaprenyldiphospho-muramoylpentapeptide beta-N-acetylglucosaminyltransferase [Acetobacteraceae bacterium]|nr:undecaprenyldiphospho-muramoylpentapeptide beta-N-acetylglucosaminyltransferase [Acetobacteraceae bacterium]